MKAKIKASEETVEVFQYGKHHFLEYIGEKTGRLFLAEELDLLDNDPDYWTRLEHQYAGMAMQGMLTHHGATVNPDWINEEAEAFAHALVEKMKEAEGKVIAEGCAFPTYEEALSTAVYMATEHLKEK